MASSLISDVARFAECFVEQSVSVVCVMWLSFMLGDVVLFVFG